MPTESALACACFLLAILQRALARQHHSARVAGGAAQQLNSFNRSRRSHRLLTCSLALCVVVFVIIMYKMTLARCRLRLSQRRPLPRFPQRLQTSICKTVRPRNQKAQKKARASNMGGERHGAVWADPVARRRGRRTQLRLATPGMPAADAACPPRSGGAWGGGWCDLSQSLSTTRARATCPKENPTLTQSFPPGSGWGGGCPSQRRRHAGG